METRIAIRAVSRLSSRIHRTSLPCCYAWYSSIQYQPAASRSRRAASTKSKQTSNKKSSRSTSQKKQSDLLETETSASRAVSRLKDILQDSLGVVHSSSLPTEAVVLESFSTYKDLAEYFNHAEESPDSSDLKTNSAAENLLFLDSHNSRSASALPAPPSAPTPFIASTIADEARAKISRTAWDLINEPRIFVTPNILEAYVTVQSLLSHPETLANAFQLYASKPVPKPSMAGTAVRYALSNPNKISTAVPLHIATAGLDAAIDKGNLPLCLDIIEHTVGATSHKRAKIVRSALIPAASLGLAPVAAYSLAMQFSIFQDTMSSANATGIAFAGILAYVGVASTMGIVALTTANDHMERVTWQSGVPLRERWLREDERHMLDLVACAWGFKQISKRGEEEGPDWQALKELVALRGMVLDRVELMEGME